MMPDPDPNDLPDDESDTGEPIADKGGVSAPMHGSDKPADGPGGTPGLSPGAVAEETERRELDFEDGAPMDMEEITQGESVIEAEYEDRGPAGSRSAGHLDEGVDPSAAADVAERDAGDGLAGTGLEADIDTDAPLPGVEDR